MAQMQINYNAKTDCRGPIYWHELTVIPVWLSVGWSYTPVSYFIGTAIEICEWLSNIIPHFMMDEIAYLCFDQS